MDVQLVGEDLQWHPILRRALRRERLCSADDGLWRGPSAGIPGAKRFERDTKSRRALRLGQAELRPNLAQG